jgi:large subunit ribosomal protein L21
MADTYAIVESGGKQYRAEKGGTLLVDRLPADEGAKVNLRAVMFRGDKETVLEADKLEKVKVEATVAGHVRGEKIRVFRYRPKKGYRKRSGHRSELTKLEVTDVRMLTRKPAAKKTETAEKPEAEKAPTAKKPAARKPAAKKPAAKKPAARKAAAKKPAARKTSTTQKKESSSDGS